MKSIEIQLPVSDEEGRRNIGPKVSPGTGNTISRENGNYIVIYREVPEIPG
jgi:hypothetical protein